MITYTLPKEYPLMLNGLATDTRTRRRFTVYNISAERYEYMSTALHCYTTGTLSLVGGLSCFEVMRKQAAFILFQARDQGYKIKRTTWLDENDSRVTTWHENRTITSEMRTP